MVHFRPLNSIYIMLAQVNHNWIRSFSKIVKLYWIGLLLQLWPCKPFISICYLHRIKGLAWLRAVREQISIKQCNKALDIKNFKSILQISDILDMDIITILGKLSRDMHKTTRDVEVILQHLVYCFLPQLIVFKQYMVQYSVEGFA